jgi:hypothetical protein
MEQFQKLVAVIANIAMVLGFIALMLLGAASNGLVGVFFMLLILFTFSSVVIIILSVYYGIFPKNEEIVPTEQPKIKLQFPNKQSRTAYITQKLEEIRARNNKN